MDPINKEIKIGGFSAFIKSLFEKGEKEEVIVPKNAAKKNLICAALTIAVAGLLYYFMLPVMNFKDLGMYVYIGAVLLTFPVLSYIACGAFVDEGKKSYVKRNSKPFIIIILVMIVVIIVGLCTSAVFFRA